MYMVLMQTLEASSSSLFLDLLHRETEIIKLLCHEMGTKQIADKLNLIAYTVESHRSNIFNKAGAANLRVLVRWAVNTGMD